MTTSKCSACASTLLCGMNCRHVCTVLLKEGGAFLIRVCQVPTCWLAHTVFGQDKSLNFTKTNQINSIYMLNWRKVHCWIIKKKIQQKTKHTNNELFEAPSHLQNTLSVKLAVYVAERVYLLAQGQLPAARKIKIPKWNPSILCSFPSLNWIEKFLREVPAKIMWGCVA